MIYLCFVITQQCRCLTLCSLHCCGTTTQSCNLTGSTPIWVATYHHAETGILPDRQWRAFNKSPVKTNMHTVQCHISCKWLFQGGSQNDGTGIRALGSPNLVMSSALSATTWMLQKVAARPRDYAHGASGKRKTLCGACYSLPWPVHCHGFGEV